MSVVRARVRRTALITAGAAALVLGPAVAAQAHVHIDPGSTVVGSDATLTFRVPTESSSASTVQVVVTLPADPPLPSVSPEAMPGWTVAVVDAPLARPVTVDGTTLTRAPHTVTWTAVRGGGVPPGQYVDLGLLVEDVPDGSALAFPTEQHYSDGTVVTWDQPTVAGQPEPEHPVPTVQLVHATPAAAASTTATTSSPASDTLARWLSLVAIVLSAAALVAVFATRRTRAVR